MGSGRMVVQRLKTPRWYAQDEAAFHCREQYRAFADATAVANTLATAFNATQVQVVCMHVWRACSKLVPQHYQGLPPAIVALALHHCRSALMDGCMLCIGMQLLW